MSSNEMKSKHPGRYIQEKITLEGMSQHDLSVRTGMTEKHISTVINGDKDISASFAKKLEYALGIPAEEWMRRQSEYDCALEEYATENDIGQEEKFVLRNLKEVIDYYIEKGFLLKDDAEYDTVLKLRKLMRVSKLTAIPNISYDASYRTQVKKNSNVDPYVLYAWQRTCELLTENVETKSELNLSVLRDSLPKIKKVMFLEQKEIEKALKTIFSECGIAFSVVRNFVGAPVQGFIKKAETGRIIMCITLRGKKADSFWFTLFHEVGHILHEDFNVRYVDVKNEGTAHEILADEFARENLLDNNAYKAFVMKRDYSIEAIKKFAKAESVKPFIVIGRLHKDEILEWSYYDDEIDRYDWVVA